MQRRACAHHVRPTFPKEPVVEYKSSAVVAGANLRAMGRFIGLEKLTQAARR
jgi:hypothetical protein